MGDAVIFISRKKKNTFFFLALGLCGVSEVAGEDDTHTCQRIRPGKNSAIWGKGISKNVPAMRATRSGITPRNIT